MKGFALARVILETSIQAQRNLKVHSIGIDSQALGIWDNQ
jgi:hypothetical protein